MFMNVAVHIARHKNICIEIQESMGIRYAVGNCMIKNVKNLD